MQAGALDELLADGDGIGGRWLQGGEPSLFLGRLHVDYVAALGLSLAMTYHVEELQVGLMGFLVP